ncbi:MAG TPA: ABC transporter permease [Terriglobia bacterium]|nr:ABC transporter permease [Terriglobia bacterium]
MQTLGERWRRVKFLFQRGQFQRDLDEEMRHHLELGARTHAEAGESPEESRFAAQRELGNALRLREESRDMWGWTLLETLLQDLRYGLRQLGRAPGLTAVVVLSLALGIGANTAIFSVINAAMLRMLPVQNPERLVQIGFQGRHSDNGESFAGQSFSYPLYKELREQNQVFTGISAFNYWDSFNAYPVGSGTGGSGEPVKGQLVSANFFSVLGVNAVVGRTFAPDEDKGAGAHPVAVISYALWSRLFARDPAAIGKKLAIEGLPFTIIGVAPAHFSGVNPGRNCDVWAPVSMQPLVAPSEYDLLTSKDTNWLTLMARLKPGVSSEQARAGLDVPYQRLLHELDTSGWSQQQRNNFFSRRVVLLPAAQGTNYLREEFARPLFLLMGMVALVLLIACANVANLLLARASVREREIAIRLALGAGRHRLIRQLLTESVMLALMGGALGVLFAYWGSPVLVALMAQGHSQVTLDVHPDLPVLGFTLLIAVVTGLAFGLAPALRATRTRETLSVQAGSRHLTVSRAGRNLGRVLVVSQVALSLVMIVGAGLLVRTFRNLETLDPGFSRDRILLFGLDPTKAGYKDERAAQLRKQIQERIEQVPGVRSASFSFLTPISGGGWDNNAEYVEGYTPRPGENTDVYINAVGTRFFQTLGIPLILGRDFGEQDQAGSTLYMVINQTMARRFFAGRNPIDKHVQLGPWSGRQGCEIIGVVGDSKYLSLRERVPLTTYINVAQLPPAMGPRGVTFEVSSAVPPMSLVPQVRNLLQSIDSRLSASDVNTLAEQVDSSLYQEKLVSALSTFFGVLALALACIGLYGVMAYAVARRTNEIGVRMALGAQRSRILQMVLREALLLAVIGVVIGLPAAWAATRSISSMLYGLNPADPVTILVATFLMAAVAGLAGYVPARRAARVDPMVALRYE